MSKAKKIQLRSEILHLQAMGYPTRIIAEKLNLSEFEVISLIEMR